MQRHDALCWNKKHDMHVGNIIRIVFRGECMGTLIVAGIGPGAYENITQAVIAALNVCD